MLHTVLFEFLALTLCLSHVSVQKTPLLFEYLTNLLAKNNISRTLQLSRTYIVHACRGSELNRDYTITIRLQR